MQTSYYKYINLLIRIVLGIGALWFIYVYLRGNWDLYQSQLINLRLTKSFIFIAMVLVLVNWGIEAYKWKFAIGQVQPITFKQAFYATLTGITASIITPNRIGEIPFRAMIVSKGNFGPITAKTIVSSFSQLIITVMVGAIALAASIDLFYPSGNTTLIQVLLVGLTLVLLLFYFNLGRTQRLLKKLKFKWLDKYINNLALFGSLDLVRLLMLSFMRYVVFAIQYFLILMAFGVQMNSFENILLIPVCFMVTSIIPTVLLSEIGVRGSVALFVFGMVSDQAVAIVLSSVTLWLINVGFPALIGIPGLKNLKVISR